VLARLREWRYEAANRPGLKPGRMSRIAAIRPFAFAARKPTRSHLLARLHSVELQA